MPSILGALEGVTNDTNCGKKPGIKHIFAAERKLVDWDAMKANALNFDSTNFEVLSYIYKTGGQHVEITFDRNTGQFDSTYNPDDKAYETVVQAVLSGKGRDRTHALRKLVDCCDLTLHLYMSDGTERVVGPEYDFEDDVFIEPVDKLAVSRHLDSQGTRGGDDPRDEIDFSGQTDYAPLFANVPVAELVASALAVEAATDPVKATSKKSQDKSK